MQCDARIVTNWFHVLLYKKNKFNFAFFDFKVILFICKGISFSALITNIVDRQRTSISPYNVISNTIMEKQKKIALKEKINYNRT